MPAMPTNGIGRTLKDYVEALEEELRGRKRGGAQDRDVAYPVERIAWDRIDEVVAREYRTTGADLRAYGRSKGAGTAKVVAIELACRLSGKTQREIGIRYRGGGSQAVSAARKRAKCRVPPDLLKRLVSMIREQPHVA